MGERVAIVGSRDYADLERVRAYVRALPLDTVIVSGGARGVDTAAEMAAKDRGMRVLIHLPDYGAHGRSAPLVRNDAIIRDCHRLVAFWDGRSRGTLDAARRARAAGKPVEVIRP